jgi:hypothetical protein
MMWRAIPVAAVLSLLTIFAGHAATIDKYFTINPIRVCNDAGASCTTATTYAAETTKIYAQANVASVFLPTTTVNSTALLSIPSVSSTSAGPGISPDASTLNVWFVQNMPTSSGTLYGEAWLGANGVAINTTAVNSFNGGIGRLDTVAHELGHNLGLGHNNFGAGGANNVMSAGSVRSIPGGIGDIAPTGAALDQLTADQITQLRSSPFVKDVPKVQVDISGSTPFNTNDFFRVTFNTGPSNVFLNSLSINLAPVNAFFDPTDNPPGLDGSPFALSGLTGLSAGDISVSGATDGSQLLTLNFGAGTFGIGDAFSFGIDVDLLSCVDCFGATPAELAGSLFSFNFSDGFGSMSAMSGTSFIADSTDVVDLFTGITFDTRLLATPPGFTAPPQVIIPPETPVGFTVSEPGTHLLIACALLALVALGGSGKPGRRAV